MKDINLIPKWYIEKKAKRRKRVKYGIIIGVVVVLLCCVITVPYTVAAQLRQTLAQQQQILAVSGKYAVMEGYYKMANDEISIRANNVKSIENGNLDNVALLQHIEKAMPIDASFNTISADTNAPVVVSLNGTVKSRDSVALMVRNLRQDSFFSNVYLQSVTLAGSANQEANQDEVAATTEKKADKTTSASNNEQKYTFSMQLTVAAAQD